VLSSAGYVPFPTLMRIVSAHIIPYNVHDSGSTIVQLDLDHLYLFRFWFYYCSIRLQSVIEQL
jgi:hypothetical protein